MASPDPMPGDPWKTTIPALRFVPPRIPPPRPWHRIAVPSATRTRKIWKRISRLPSAPHPSGYAATFAELGRQGRSRKRPRTAAFVPVWGDAPWQLLVGGGGCDGSKELEEAKASVRAAEEAEATTLGMARACVSARKAASGEGRLRWVPRKRNSSRWPIEPCAKDAATVADAGFVAEAQPPFAGADTSIPEDVARPADEEQMRRRSTRRLSRRASLAPPSETMPLSPIVSRPPTKESPSRRCLRRLSPTKVSDSPRKLFTVLATPSMAARAVPGKEVSPAESSVAPMSLSSVQEISVDESPASGPATSPPSPPSPSILASLPLRFDQPVPDIQVEPEHEVRRRVSLHNARRFDGQTSRIKQLVGSGSRRSAPSRRHSCLSVDDRDTKIRARRHTMDMLDAALGEVRLAATPSPVELRAEPQSSAGEPRPDAKAAVVVDVGTNLDIFGQGPETPSLFPPSVTGQQPGDPGKPSLSPTPPREPKGLSTILEDSTGTGNRMSGPDDTHSVAGRQSTTHSAVPTTAEMGSGIKSPSSAEHLSTSTWAAVEMPGEMSESVAPDPDDELHSNEMARATTAQIPSSPTASDDAVVTPDEGADDMRLNVDWDSQETASAGVDTEQEGIPCATPETETPPRAGADSFTLADPSTDLAPEPTVGYPITLTCTPPKEGTIVRANAGNDDESEKVLETPPARKAEPRFSRDRQSSPQAAGCGGLPDDGVEADDDTDEAECEGIVRALDYEPTVPIEVEGIALVAAGETLPDPATLQEESDSEMLRQFVTRVRAGRTAKAAAAALTRGSLRPKRRSGSTGSTGSAASAAGSPMAKFDSPLKRLPLGEKDRNSPSPSKKRKAAAVSDEDCRGKATLFSEQRSSPTRTTKRRRKRLDAELETTLDQSMSLGQPEAGVAKAGLRRSTRSRAPRVQLRPQAPSANSIALSMVPVRLPGSAGMLAGLDKDPAAAAVRNRSDDKDLAAATRANTRKNKGAAVPPEVVLARQAEDPAAWRMRELRSVFDARESRNPDGGTTTGGDGREGRASKGVHWAEDLVRFQGGATDPPVPVSRPSTRRGREAAAEAAARVSPAAELRGAGVAPEAEGAQQPEEERAARRASASRPRMTAPVRKTRVAAGSRTGKPTHTAGAATPSDQQPSKDSTASPSTSSSSSSTLRMATRRTRVSGLGMSGNGTPAPKRRTRTVV